MTSEIRTVEESITAPCGGLTPPVASSQRFRGAVHRRELLDQERNHLLDVSRRCGVHDQSFNRCHERFDGQWPVVGCEVAGCQCLLQEAVVCGMHADVEFGNDLTVERAVMYGRDEVTSRYEVPDEPGQCRREICCSTLLGHGQTLIEEVFEGGNEQMVLGFEVPIDGIGGHAAIATDRRHGGRFEAVGKEELTCGSGQLFAFLYSGLGCPCRRHVPTHPSLLLIDDQEATTVPAKMFGSNDSKPAFPFDLDARELLAERRGQFLGWGMSRRTLAEAESRVADAWGEGPGGWVFEWSRLAEQHELRGAGRQASLAFGAAKFPALASDSRRAAYENQLRTFRSTGLTERHTVSVPYRGDDVDVVIHRYRARRARAALCLTGGVDTWKVELHRLAATMSRLGRLDITVFDMPGTGESTVPLAADADEIYAGVLNHIRVVGQPTGVMGISFGGLWAAKLALSGSVDFAIDLGGPVGSEDRSPDEIAALPNGMNGIIAHSLWLDQLPDRTELGLLIRDFSLRRELSAPAELPVPLLVVNGTDDPLLPAGDTEVFRRFDRATVWHVQGAGHCAAERFRSVVAGTLGWISNQVRSGPLNRAAVAAASALL